MLKNTPACHVWPILRYKTVGLKRVYRLLGIHSIRNNRSSIAEDIELTSAVQIAFLVTVRARRRVRQASAATDCVPYCYYYLRVLYFANFCDLQKIAKLSTRKNFYEHIRHVYIKSETGFPFWNMHNHSL